VNGVKLAEIIFSLLCACVCVSMRTQSHWFEWAECWEMYLIRAWKVENISIRSIYRWNQWLIGFLMISQVLDGSGGFGEMYKNVTLISCKMYSFTWFETVQLIFFTLTRARDSSPESSSSDCISSLCLRTSNALNVPSPLKPATHSEWVSEGFMPRYNWRHILPSQSLG